MIRLQGRRVTLRPFRDEDFDIVWLEERRDRGPFFEPLPDTREQRERLRSILSGSGAWTRTQLRLAIEADGSLAGDIQARRDEDAMPPGVFELGLGVFAGVRGRGLGTEALALMTSYLFDEEQAHRVQLSTDVDNAAMRRIAERIGFVCEGVLRGFMPARDGVRDYALYAMTRGDHEDGRTPWTQTG
jgi:[ribosomal protein S5]-alanine N-acetyltransferase